MLLSCRAASKGNQEGDRELSSGTTQSINSLKPCILPQRCNIKIIGARRISKLKCGEKEYVLRIHNGLLRKNELKRSGKTREEVEYKSCRIEIGSPGAFVSCSGKATDSSGGDQMA